MGEGAAQSSGANIGNPLRHRSRGIEASERPAREDHRGKQRLDDQMATEELRYRHNVGGRTAQSPAGFGKRHRDNPHIDEFAPDSGFRLTSHDASAQFKGVTLIEQPGEAVAEHDLLIGEFEIHGLCLRREGSGDCGR